MVAKVVIKYVRDGLASGLSLDQIKRNLKANGWSDEEINSAANIANSRIQNSSQGGIGVSPDEGLSKNIWILLGIVLFFIVVAILLIFVFNVFDNNGEMKTCSELGGFVCSASEDCDGGWLDASDVYDCCSVSCTAICNENWVCGNWSECVNGTQTRECDDANNCGTEIYLPVLNRSCGESSLEENCNANGVCNLDCVSEGGDPDCSCEAQNNASTQNITICGKNQLCNGSEIYSDNDSISCCMGFCYVDPCSLNGVCDLNCTSRGGDPDCNCFSYNETVEDLVICAPNHACDGVIYEANTSGICCSGECVTSCEDDGFCVRGCEEGDPDCECEEQGGTLCDIEETSSLCYGGEYPILASDNVTEESICCVGQCGGQQSNQAIS